MLQHIEYLTHTISLRFGESVHLAGTVAHDETNALLFFVTDEDTEVLSIDLDTYGLSTPQGHVWIKDWSEHAGVTSQLASLGVVEHKATAHVGPFESPAHMVKILTTQGQGN